MQLRGKRSVRDQNQCMRRGWEAKKEILIFKYKISLKNLKLI